MRRSATLVQPNEMIAARTQTPRLRSGFEDQMAYGVVASLALSAVLLSACVTPLPASDAPTWLKCKWRTETSFFVQQGTVTTKEQRRLEKRHRILRVRLSGAPTTPNVYRYEPKTQQLSLRERSVFGPDTILIPFTETYAWPSGSQSISEGAITIDRRTLKLRQTSLGWRHEDRSDETQHILELGQGACRIIEAPPMRTSQSPAGAG